MAFDILSYPIIYTQPRWLTVSTSWSEHIPFAMFLVQIHRPRALVELGSLAGDSYCAFCQAIADLNIDCKCMAVDTWKGDKHAGFYPEDLYRDLHKYHESQYARFSRMNRTDFDSAAKEVPDGSLDICHIDGLHTYDAVKHDYETWLPKMSDRGVMLFHDTAIRNHLDFGVYKLWEEITPGKLAFEFHHCAGLGVLAVGDKIPAETKAFLEAAMADQERYRTLFNVLGHIWGERVDRGRINQKMQMYLNGLHGWRKKNKLHVDPAADDASLLLKDPHKGVETLWQEIQMTADEHAKLTNQLAEFKPLS